MSSNHDMGAAPRDRRILVYVVGTGPNAGQRYGWHIAQWALGGWWSGSILMDNMHQLHTDELSAWCELPGLEP